MNKSYAVKYKKDKSLVKAGIFVCFLGVFLSLIAVIKLNPLNTSHNTIGDNTTEWKSRDLLQKEVECRKIQDEPEEDKCNFVRTTDSCGIAEGFINYNDVTYCKFPRNLLPLALVIQFIWWLFIFIGLAVTADDFFCPDLAIISDTLNLSPNVAGVTFLAFGNGAADIFSAIAGFLASKGGDVGLAIGGLFGAGIFVTTVIAGAIAIISPFKAMERPLLRDIIFYLGALFWTFVIFYRGEIFLAEAIGFIALYFFYVIVVVASQQTFDKQQDSRRRSMMSDVEMSGHRPSVQLEMTADGKRTLSHDVNKNTVTQVAQAVQTFGVGSLRLVLTPLELDPRSLESQYTNDAFTSDEAKKKGSKAGNKMSKRRKSKDSQEGDKETQIDQNPDGPNTNEKSESATANGNAVATNGKNTDNITKGKVTSSTEDSNKDKLATEKKEYSVVKHEPDTSSAEEKDDLEINIKDPNADLKETKVMKTLVRQSSQVSFSDDLSTVAISRAGSRRVSLATESSFIEDLEKRRIAKEEALQVREHPLKQLFYKAFPIRIKEWHELRWYARIYEIFKSPVQFFLNISIPVVNYDIENKNWNRYLSCLNLLIGPTWIIVGFRAYGVMLGGVFPLPVLTLLIGLVFAIIVFFTSKDDKPPVYHNAFGFVGFVVAIVWIYVMANEIVNLLKMFGVVFNISDAILGLTLLAWGNSVADFIADTVMARIGRPRIGFTACFGGTLFNLLLGVGIPFTLRLVQEGRVLVTYSLQNVILTAGMGMSLLFSFISIPIIFRFKLGRTYGICCIILYVAFLIVAILAEVGVIKGEIRKI